jgi:hypothetical protein
MTGRPSRLRAALPVPADLAVRADHVAGVVVDGEAGQVEPVSSSPACQLVSGGSGPPSWTPWSSAAERICPTLT